jgi:catalase
LDRWLTAPFFRDLAPCRDVEQAAFSPGSLVPGIELSPDTLLQWRAFFYRDAQIHRLGSANIHQIPVNCPFMSKFHSPDNFNGTMRVDGNAAGKPLYVRPIFPLLSLAR